MISSSARARLLPLVMLSTLIGCSTMPLTAPVGIAPGQAYATARSIPEPAARDMAVGYSAAAPTSVAAPAGTVDSSTEAPLPAAAETLVRGHDRLYAPPGPRPPVHLSDNRISLNFDQAPVTEVVHAVIGDLLGLPYVIHQPVAGTVTIQTHNPLPQDQILAVFESLLQGNGLAIVRDASGIHHVGKPDALRGIAPVFGNVGQLPAGHKMVVVPLRYIGAAAMAEIIEALAGPEALLRVDGTRNLVVLAGTGPQLEGWLEIVNSFDVDILSGMSVGLFPLQHMPVADMHAALDAVFAGVDGDAAVGKAAAAEDGRTAVRGLIRLMPIEQMNALLVVTPRAHYLDQVRDWVVRFDRAGNNGIEAQLYVYPVQNGAAEHLAHLLNAVFGGELSQQAQTTSQRPVAPGLAQVALGDGVGVAEDSVSPLQGVPGRGQRDRAGNTDVAQVTIGANIRVVADVRNNALLIHAPPGSYGKIEAALRRLDVAPNQVLIEASILEVSLNDELKYGLQWAFSGGIGGRGHSGTGVLGNNPVSGQIRPGGQPGFSYTITNSIGDIRAVLNALADKSLVNVISSPSVLVQDNHTATIQVGDQQPVRSARAVTDGGTSIENIEFKDTGVMLSVTPSVNAGGLVSMLIDQSVTDVGPQDEATGQRSFLQRHISSKVAVRSGETVVLGGLIRDNTTRGRQGVPGLQDMPVLGTLFSTTTRNASRTELLVMITPRVVRTESELRQAGDELRRRMRSLERLPERIGTSHPSLSVEKALPIPVGTEAQ